jgi:catechol 2,3-dioxygenase-like lactoylglutathione lyase family enzyme
MQVLQSLHTALLVANLEKAEYFYGTVLGLPKVVRSLKYLGAWYQIGPYQIHLIQDDKVVNNLHNAEKWGRNPHIAFAVADLDVAKQQLADAGFPIQPSSSGRAALFTQDPDGHVIELSQV